MGLSRMYLRDTNAALVVYDKTNSESLRKAELWIEELKNTAPSEILICLCANKLDEFGNHKLNHAEGASFARKY